MSNSRKLMSNNWDFTLYEASDSYFVMDVVFYASFADYSRSFKFNKEEIELDIEKLKSLAEDIRGNYQLYKNKEINQPSK